MKFDITYYSHDEPYRSQHTIIVPDEPKYEGFGTDDMLESAKFQYPGSLLRCYMIVIRYAIGNSEYVFKETVIKR